MTALSHAELFDRTDPVQPVPERWPARSAAWSPAPLTLVRPPAVCEDDIETVVDALKRSADGLRHWRAGPASCAEPSIGVAARASSPVLARSREAIVEAAALAGIIDHAADDKDIDARLARIDRELEMVEASGRLRHVGWYLCLTSALMTASAIALVLF